MHETLRRIRFGTKRLGGVQDVQDLSVEEPVDQPVGTKHEEISGLESHGSDLRVDKLVPGAQRPLKRVAPGVLASFPFADLGVAEEPAHMSIVMANLFD